MSALSIISTIIGVALWIFSGVVCGRICANIIRKKDAEMDEVLWFWYGFLCQWIAVICAILIKKEDK